jgi:hypothetical protein
MWQATMYATDLLMNATKSYSPLAGLKEWQLMWWLVTICASDVALRCKSFHQLIFIVANALGSRPWKLSTS